MLSHKNLSYCPVTLDGGIALFGMTCLPCLIKVDPFICLMQLLEFTFRIYRKYNNNII